MKKFVYVLVIVIALLHILPIFHTFANSYMAPNQLASEELELLPQPFNLQQYYKIIFYKSNYFDYFMNSIKITGIIIIGQIVLGVMAAYAFAKMKFPGRDFLFLLYIMVILLPFQVTMVPNHLLFDQVDKLLGIKIIDTHWALILPGAFHSFGVFLLRQFIKSVPDEIIEAARIDGAGDMRIFFRVILPMIKPAVFTLVILTFIDNWNLIEQAIVFIETDELMPLSMFLEMIFHQDGTVFYAASVLYIVPAILIFIKGKKYLNEGLSLGGMK